MSYKTHDFSENRCKFCGKFTNYELCRECYMLSKDNYIIKNEEGVWIKNVRKDNEYRFYDENKEYKLKQEIMNEYEMRVYNLIKNSLPKKYSIIPQVNLQSIITTNTNRRNDELFRNVDFALFHSKDFTPFLIIELNGQQHYNNDYIVERDKSVKQILEKVKLPLLTVDIKNIKQMTNNQLLVLFRKVVKYLNPSFFKKLFGKKTDKMNLLWTREYIK